MTTVDPTTITLEDLPPITNPSDATEALNKLEELTVVPFEKLRNREPLTEAEITNLELADKVIVRVIEYDPVNPGYASIQAKVQIALGQLDDAKTTLSNALINQPSEMDKTTELIYADLHADLSRVHFEQGEYLAANDEIQAARTVFPQDPYYLTDQAHILLKIAVQESSQTLLDKSKELCDKALEFDPGHRPAAELLESLEDFELPPKPEDGS